MILEYERSRMRSLEQKHLDRIEALRTAESGTAEEQEQAIKEYAENSKRFNVKGSDESVKISLQDILCILWKNCYRYCMISCSAL